MADGTGDPLTSGAEAGRAPSKSRWTGLRPVRVAWIVDARREFLGGQGPIRVFGTDGLARMPAPEALAALTRAVRWMASECSVLVYEDWTEGERAGLIDAIRPVNPLVLSRDADDEQAEDLACRALAEGRAVVLRRSRNRALEKHSARGAFLAAVEDFFDLPVEVVVAGVARDRSMERAADGLISHCHAVTVIRDGICWVGARPREEALPGRGSPRSTVASLAALRRDAAGYRQMSFADIEIGEAYEHLDRIMRRMPGFRVLDNLGAEIPWELFRSRLEASRMDRTDALRGDASLFATDALVAFKSILLGAMYGLTDDALEFHLLDRLSFRRFTGLGMADRPPSARMLRLHLKRWTKTGVMAELVADVDRRWRGKGYRFQGLQTLTGSSSPRSRDGAPVEEVRPEMPGGEPVPPVVRKRGGGKKRLTRS